MSILDTLVTTRTQADVTRAREILDKYQTQGWNSLTSEEKELYNAGFVGSYNYTDLNRVGEACNYVYSLFVAAGLPLSQYQTLKTDWAQDDYPTKEQLTTYYNSIRTLKDAAIIASKVPSGIEGLTAVGANQIEQMLLDAANQMNTIWLRLVVSGEVYSGEV